MVLQQLIKVARENGFKTIDITDYDVVFKHKYRTIQLVLKDDCYSCGNKIMFKKVNCLTLDDQPTVYNEYSAYNTLDEMSPCDLDMNIRDIFNYFNYIWNDLYYQARLHCSNEYNEILQKIRELNKFFIKKKYFTENCYIKFLVDNTAEDKEYIRIDYYDTYDSNNLEREPIYLEYVNGVLKISYDHIRMTITDEYPFEEYLTTLDEIIRM